MTSCALTRGDDATAVRRDCVAKSTGSQPDCPGPSPTGGLSVGGLVAEAVIVSSLASLR